MKFILCLSNTILAAALIISSACYTSTWLQALERRW